LASKRIRGFLHGALRFVWGILLLPLALATIFHLPGLLTAFGSDPDGWIPLLLGLLCYGVFEVAFSRPLRTYVFGHELTHALAAIVTGAKVFSFNVSKKGGSVTLSESNFFIALAPYCVPIYTLFVFIVYAVLKFWFPVQEYRWLFHGLVGFSFAFHASLTFYAIRQSQPDIESMGFFFSMVFIVLANAWMIAGTAKLLFWNAVSLKAFTVSVFQTQWIIWRWSAGKFWSLLQRGWEHARTPS
jgi:hypothetical protein